MKRSIVDGIDTQIKKTKKYPEILIPNEYKGSITRIEKLYQGREERKQKYIKNYSSLVIDNPHINIEDSFTDDNTEEDYDEHIIKFIYYVNVCYLIDAKGDISTIIDKFTKANDDDILSIYSNIITNNKDLYDSIHNKEMFYNTINDNYDIYIESIMKIFYDMFTKNDINKIVDFVDFNYLDSINLKFDKYLNIYKDKKTNIKENIIDMIIEIKNLIILNNYKEYIKHYFINHIETKYNISNLLPMFNHIDTKYNTLHIGELSRYVINQNLTEDTLYNLLLSVVYNKHNYYNKMLLELIDKIYENIDLLLKNLYPIILTIDSNLFKYSHIMAYFRFIYVTLLGFDSNVSIGSTPLAKDFISNMNILKKNINIIFEQYNIYMKNNIYCNMISSGINEIDMKIKKYQGIKNINSIMNLLLPTEKNTILIEFNVAINKYIVNDRNNKIDKMIENIKEIIKLFELDSRYISSSIIVKEDILKFLKTVKEDLRTVKLGYSPDDIILDNGFITNLLDDKILKNVKTLTFFKDINEYDHYMHIKLIKYYFNIYEMLTKNDQKYIIEKTNVEITHSGVYINFFNKYNTSLYHISLHKSDGIDRNKYHFKSNGDELIHILDIRLPIKVYDFYEDKSYGYCDSCGVLTKKKGKFNDPKFNFIMNDIILLLEDFINALICHKKIIVTSIEPPTRDFYNKYLKYKQKYLELNQVMTNLNLK